MITKKQKFLWIMVIAILTVLVAFACKRKPTQTENFQVIEQVEQTPTPENKSTYTDEEKYIVSNY